MDNKLIDIDPTVFLKYTIPHSLKELALGHLRCKKDARGDTLLYVLTAKNDYCALVEVFRAVKEKTKNAMSHFYSVEEKSTIVVFRDEKGGRQSTPYIYPYTELIEKPNTPLPELVALEDVHIQVVGEKVIVSYPDQVEVVKHNAYQLQESMIHAFKLSHKYLGDESEHIFAVAENNKTFLLAKNDPRVREAIEYVKLVKKLMN